MIEGRIKQIQGEILAQQARARMMPRGRRDA